MNQRTAFEEDDRGRRTEDGSFKKRMDGRTLKKRDGWLDGRIKMDGWMEKKKKDGWMEE